jgi:hypothetical protein
MKKTWNTPELTVHGSVESLTQAKPKKFGGNDGFVLIIVDIPVPITDA